MEFGKSIPVRSQLVSKIKFVADLGFLCWQATAAQDDAPMYGIKIIVEKDRWSLENTLAGYHGWMHANKNYWPDYGDTPLVNSTKLTIPTSRLNYFAQYQVGIKDFPYRQIRLGMSFALGKLTPRF